MMPGPRRSLVAAPKFICRRCCQSALRIRRQWTRPYSTTQDDIYDLVCVGGGPAGLSLLAALRASSITSRLRVALVEAQDLVKATAFSLPPTEFSNRCSSLTPMSAQYFHAIGAWSHFKRQRIQEFHEMQVWDGVTGARIEFDRPAGSGGPGSIIAFMTENRNLTAGLLSRIRQLGQVAVFDSARVDKIELGQETEDMDLSEWPVVRLSNGHSLAARLLVGADGANSPVREFARIQSRGWDYGRHGLVATLKLEGQGWGGQSSKIAYQRFLPTGPVAMLPLPGNYATLVWTTTPDHAALLKELSPEDFIATINAAFRLSPVDIRYMHAQTNGQQDEYDWRMQHTAVDPQSVPQTVVEVQRGSIASFPLKMRHADTYIGERVALVGDAAHTIHPLAGQGLNQGQGDVQSLVRSIEYAVAHGQDLGSHLSLESYNSERYAANHVILGVCDKLHKLYSVESGPLVGLRSIGLQAVNALSPLKRFLINQASGTGLKMV